MAENRHIQHVRSKVVENGKAKLPSSSSLLFGEIAVNYAKDHETLSIKNESGDVITFHPNEVQIGTSADTILESTTVFIDTEMDDTVQVYTKEQVDSQISGFSADISSIKNVNTTQDNRIEALETKDAAHDVRLNGIDARLSGIDESISAQDGEIININENINNLSSGITNLESELANVSGDTQSIIGDGFTSANTITSQFNSLSNDVGIISGDVLDLDGKVDDLIIIGDTTPTSQDTELFVDTSDDGGAFVVYTKAQVDTIVADLQRQINELRSH